MPPSLEHSRAVAKINSAGLSLVAAQHPNAIQFRESYTLRHVPVGTRLLICVFDEEGNNITPPDESRNFHSTDIVVGTEISSMYMGPRTTCKDLSMTTSKQSAYTKAIPGDKASEKFFSELIRVFEAEHYAQAVKDHPVHSAKQGKFLKGGDAIKGIDALVRKGKLFTPIRESDDGVPSEVVMRRKVFSSRSAYKETGTDYDNEAIQEFCTSQNGDVCVDPVPVFYADGTRCTEYDSIRSSSAAMVVYSLRPDWVNSDLGNISWPCRLEYMQPINLSVGRSDAVVTAPNLMDDNDNGINLTDGKARSPKRHGDPDEDEDVTDNLDEFVAKRTRSG